MAVAHALAAEAPSLGVKLDREVEKLREARVVSCCRTSMLLQWLCFILCSQTQAARLHGHWCAVAHVFRAKGRHCVCARLEALQLCAHEPVCLKKAAGLRRRVFEAAGCDAAGVAAVLPVPEAVRRGPPHAVLRLLHRLVPL